VLLSQLHQQIHLALVTSLIMQSVNDTTSQVPSVIAIWPNMAQTIGMFTYQSEHAIQLRVEKFH
jgi:hypothetical protein